MTVGVAIVSLWDSPQGASIPMSDKVLHGMMYFFLALSWLIPLMHASVRSRRSYVYVCATVTLYGALIEVLQHYCTSTRSGELIDVLADFIGALTGVLLVVLWRTLFMTSR